MLSISQSQMKFYEQQAFRQYQQKLVSHVREHFPGHARYLGQRGLLQLVQRGCEMAERHGFETERDICLYTDLTIMLGTGFDSDPQLAWVPEILNDPTLVDARGRMDELWEQATAYMEQVLGPDEVFPKLAYQMDRKRRVGGLGKLTPEREDALMFYLHDIWPEKARYVGTAALRALMDESSRVARHFGMDGGTGQTRMLIYAFLFGHSFHADALYPWVGDILGDVTIGAADERGSRMVKAFDAQLGDGWCEPGTVQI